MNLNDLPGTKIVFRFPKSGSKGEQKRAQKYLKIGGVYTVKKVEIGNWHSNVYLEEVPGIAFNTVFFTEAEV